MTDEDLSRYIFYAKTVDSGAFKTLSECVKTIFTELCFSFEPAGIKSLAINQEQSILMHLFLQSTSFQVYHSTEVKKVGLDTEQLFKIMRTMSNNDILTLYVERSDENKLGIIFDNDEKKRTTKYKLKLLDTSMPDVHIPDEVFPSVITLPSGDLSKLLRDMVAIDSKQVEFQSIGTKLIFRCKESTGSITQETILGENTDGLAITNPSEDIVQGVYNLQQLSMMSKCTGLCSTVRIYAKNDYALLCRFTVARLGELTFAFMTVPGK